MTLDGINPDAPPTPVGFDDIVTAAATIAGFAHRTPAMSCAAITAMAGAADVVFKCENLQRVGAFKFRGACNAIRQLSDDEQARGVVTWSSGNHAQAVALSAALTNTRATIVMPTNAPAVKRRATEAYLERAPKGSAVVPYDPATQVREEVGGAIAAEQGAVVIPPYDHPHVIAGQGTAGMELIEDAGPFDLLFVCVGGGGLLSGCGLAAKAMSPACRVIGVEPELADDATRSFRTRTLHTVSNPPTIADGARTPYLGRYTFPLVLQVADDMLTVSDAELVAAMRLVWERMKIVIEPTGALGIAGLLRLAKQDPESVRGKRVGVIISGGNVDLDALPSIFGAGTR